MEGNPLRTYIRELHPGAVMHWDSLAYEEVMSDSVEVSISLLNPSEKTAYFDDLSIEISNPWVAKIVQENQDYLSCSDAAHLQE